MWCAARDRKNRDCKCPGEFGENGFCANGADRAACGYKSERRNDDFVTSLNAAGAQRENQRLGSRGDTDSVSGAAELRDFRFERGTFASQNKLLRGQDFFDRGANFMADRGVLRGEIELRHRLERGCGLCWRGH